MLNKILLTEKFFEEKTEIFKKRDSTVFKIILGVWIYKSGSKINSIFFVNSAEKHF